MSDGKVVFEINGDARNVNQAIKEVTQNIQQEGKKWDQAVSDSTGAGEKSFLSLKTVAAGAFAAIGAAALNFGKQAIDAASDLAEVQNVVDTVFGDGATQIEAWSKKAGQQFGLTELQAKKFSSTLGAMMKSSGLAGNEIINMSTDLAGLAADMASFYNLDFETAFEKIRSGISGETMPLKQLGINMSVANLEAFALAQGLEKTFSQMDQGEQTMLRYQYLMQATADAQGDFEKTSDGFANAQRRIQTSVDTIKTSLGTVLLPVVENVTSAVADFLTEITKQPERTVLDDFNDIEVDTAQKMANLEETYAKAEAIIKLIDEIQKMTVTLKDGSTVTFEELFKDLGNVEKSGGDVRGYLESLGVDVDYVIQKYNTWKESTRQLTSLVPSLTSAIDSETGAIEGGTDALQKNLDEWKANEEKKLAWAAVYAKERALIEKKAQLYAYEFDAGAAHQRLKKARAALENIYKVTFDQNGRVATLPGLMSADGEKQWRADLIHYNLLLEDATEKEKELERQTEALADATADFDSGRQAVIDKYGEEEQAVEAVSEAISELTEEQKKAGKEAVNATSDALKALSDYVQGVKDSTEQAVNSVVKGFDKVTTAWDELNQKSRESANDETDVLNKYSDVWNKFGSDNISLKDMAAGWDKLSNREKEAYEALVKVKNAQKETNDALNQYKPEGMKAGLQSQIEYMEQYLQNLETLKSWGISGDLLASLSDGSTESASYLAGLVAGGKEGAEDVADLYSQVSQKKEEFTDALTQEKLTADQVYDDLVQKALDSIADLDLGEEAQSAMADTVGGLAQGIADHVSEVQAAVDLIEEQLNRLSAFGISFDLSSGGPELVLNGEHETGLDYVPFDGYLAGLHEGEGILTAEENRIWQRFKNGQYSNIDYDSLGGVMRDNIKAGGDVYLDGRTVGQVVSGIQGRNYKTLQRSGWQG